MTEIQRLRLQAEWASYPLPYELPAKDVEEAQALVRVHTAGRECHG